MCDYTICSFTILHCFVFSVSVVDVDRRPLSTVDQSQRIRIMEEHALVPLASTRICRTLRRCNTPKRNAPQKYRNVGFRYPEVFVRMFTWSHALCPPSLTYMRSMRIKVTAVRKFRCIGLPLVESIIITLVWWSIWEMNHHTRRIRHLSGVIHLISSLTPMNWTRHRAIHQQMGLLPGVF